MERIEEWRKIYVFTDTENRGSKMNVAYMMEYKYPVDEKSSIEMVPYSTKYQDKYKRVYNECYHEMREQLNIKPYDYLNP